MTLKLDTPHYVNGDVSAFFNAHPPPPLLQVSRDQFYHHFAYLEDELWRNSSADKKISKSQPYLRDIPENDKYRGDLSSVQQRTREIPLKKELSHPLALNLDLTSTRKRHEKHLSRQASYTEPSHEAFQHYGGVIKKGERSHSHPSSQRTSPITPDNHTDYRDVNSMVAPSSKHSITSIQLSTKVGSVMNLFT